MYPVFPQEILNLIVESFAHQGHKLAPLLLVSKSLYYPARAFVFRQLSITFHIVRPSDSRISLLLHILNSSPEILQLINGVLIDISQHDEDNRAITGPHPARRPENQNPDFVTLLNLLAKAPINALSIRAWMYSFALMDLGKTTLKALIGLRCTPSLNTLALHNLARIPRLFLTGNPANDRLCHLVLEDLHPYCTRPPLYPFSEEEGLPDFLLPEPSSPPFSSLEVLSMDEPASILLNLCSLNPRSLPWENALVDVISRVKCDFGSLRVFNTKLGPYAPRLHYQAIRHILDRAPSLKALLLQAHFAELPTYRFKTLDDVDTPRINFRSLPKLNHIALSDEIKGPNHPAMTLDVLRGMDRLVRSGFYLFESDNQHQDEPLGLKELTLDFAIDVWRQGIWPWAPLEYPTPGDAPRSGSVPSLQKGEFPLAAFFNHPGWRAFNGTLLRIRSLKKIRISLNYCGIPPRASGLVRILLQKDDILRCWKEDPVVVNAIERKVKELGDSGRVEVEIALETYWMGDSS